MSTKLVHSAPDLVDVIWRSDLDAVHLLWHSEYDEGTRVRDAVLAALDFVNSNGVRNWLVDISGSKNGLSEADMNWVQGTEFRHIVSVSCLKRFALVPPRPETGQDTEWLADWERQTLSAFGPDKSALISSDIEEIEAFFQRTDTDKIGATA